MRHFFKFYIIYLLLLAPFCAFAETSELLSAAGRIDSGADTLISSFTGIQDIQNMNDLMKNSQLSGDTYEMVGDNLVLKGNVFVVSKNQKISADKIIINTQTEEYEALGNVRYNTLTTKSVTMTVDEYLKASQDPTRQVSLERYVADISGQQKVQVNVLVDGFIIQAERAAGSFATGIAQFYHFGFKSGAIYCVGERCERSFDGTLEVHKANFTTCEYLTDAHDHYSISAYKASFSPREAGSSMFNYSNTPGDHSITMLSSFLEIYGIPILWLPAFYKPADFSSFGGKMEFGSTSDWGWYFRLAKNFLLMNEPYWNTNLMFDYYAKRGVGFGVSSDFLTPESSTEFFFYNVWDKRPYEYWDHTVRPEDDPYRNNNSRLGIPHYRYELRLNNLTHITRNLDFRAQLDLLSDYHFLRDFYPNRFSSEFEPPTFLSLEYQHEYFTASIYTKLRMNDFFTSVDRLPELRLDFQRQELFANLYYQGELSFTPLFMRWRDFDRKMKGDDKWVVNNYDALRFDSLNMFYYPINLFGISIIPRTGIRMTLYSKSSANDVTLDDLNDMFIADAIEGLPSGIVVNNFDSKGGAKFRIMGELGVEATTKFYRTWNDVRVPMMNLDGLRHVIEPYVNYTFIPRSSVNSDSLYYFDEIDRISEYHFVRVGLTNRLQTRRGDAIMEWLSVEAFWDYYIQDDSKLNNFGDIGIVFKATPFDGVTLTHEMLLDVGGNNDHRMEATRGRRKVGRPGINKGIINRMSTNLSYQFAPEWRIYAGYNYVDGYYDRFAYSMGSTVTSVATSSLLCAYQGTRTQTVSGGLEFPIPILKDFKGSFNLSYDIEEDLFNSAYCRLLKRFHCWYVAAEFGFSQSWDSRRNGKYYKRLKHYLSFQVGLAAMPSLAYGPRVGND